MLDSFENNCISYGKRTLDSIIDCSMASNLMLGMKMSAFYAFSIRLYRVIKFAIQTRTCDLCLNLSHHDTDTCFALGGIVGISDHASLNLGEGASCDGRERETLD